MDVFCSAHCRCKGCKNCDPALQKPGSNKENEVNLGKRVPLKKPREQGSPTFGQISISRKRVMTKEPVLALEEA